VGANEWRSPWREPKAAEIQLLSEVQQARETYELAKRAFDEATQRAHSIGLDHADSAHGLLNATKAYNHALRHYTEALKKFSQLVLRVDDFPKDDLPK